MSRRARREHYDDDLYEYERERDRDRYVNGPRRDRVLREDLDYRRRGPPVEELERLRLRDHSAPDFMRETFEPRRETGQLVLRREDDEADFPRRDRRGFERERERDDTYRRRAFSRDRPPTREVERDELIFEEKKRDRRRYSDLDDDDEIDEIRYRGRDRSLPPRGYDSDEIPMRRERRDERHRDRHVRDYDRDDFDFRYSDRENFGGKYERERDDFRYRSRRRGGDEEEIIIRKGEREPSRRRRDLEKDEEIIIRNRHERSSSPELPSSWEPPVVRAPPIHQEVVTHHRHIDHGFETVRAPPAPSPELRSPRSSFDELEIHHRSKLRGRSSHEGIIIERRGKDDSLSPLRRHSPETYNQSRNEEIVISHRRPRSLDREKELRVRERGRRNSLDSRDERDIQEEADFYGRRNAERSYTGEAYNGATRDWTIVDVPPGTKRVTMDGAGGAGQEISWQRYNGVRRSRFLPNGDDYSDDEMERGRGRIGRRYFGAKDKRDRLWTEITKDLVVREAIERAGYEYEETEYFYYIFSHLEYNDIAALADLSDDIRRARRERIHEIHRERLSLPPARSRRPKIQAPVLRPLPHTSGPWEGLKVKEELIIEDTRRPSHRSHSRRWRGQ